MSNEQIEYLKNNDIPYSPALFAFVNRSFKRYCATLNLAAYRSLGWEDSDRVEEIYSRLKRS